MTGLPWIGVVAADPLRIVGLETILGADFAVKQLQAPTAAELAELELVIIDGTATEHLFPLIDAFHRMRPQLRLIVLGVEQDADYTERVIGTGVQGYLSHRSSEDELRRAVSVVREGSMWAPRQVLARLLEKARQELKGMVAAPVTLSRRERDVLRLLVRGRSNVEIARTLKIEEGTVKSYLFRMMRKAGVTNRTALSMQALEGGWLRS